MFALGVFAQGVEWPGQEERKQVVALLLAATDVGETFIGYMGRLLGIFRKNQPLIDALVAAHTPEEVVGILKRADAAAQDAREKKRREKARVVLLVESIEDEITVGRQEILAKSPRIRGYRIEYIYAVRESAQGAPDFNEAEFAQRLSARIADLKPQFVLFHTGHIYQQHISWFEDLVRGLRGRFGDVRFGYQEKRSLASPEGVFSYDDETKGIQTLVFRNILGI
jgi:hypothetical protein